MTFSENPIAWIALNFVDVFPNAFIALSQPKQWLDWVTWNNTLEDKQSLMRFIYYGASIEFAFFVVSSILIFTILGLIKPKIMWRSVVLLETLANRIGRSAAWAGLAMVLIQIVIIFLQRIFAVSQISIGFVMTLAFDVSWWSESLKLYNAIIIALCVSYTFVQGGHVRVDLFYSAVGYRTRKIIDMVGSLFFMIPSAILIWMYSWFFFWRHMIVPKPSASDAVDRLVMKARAFRWNVETIGFSPNGFNAYFLFKVLILAFTALIFIHAVSFFYRSLLELRGGDASEGLRQDLDLRPQDQNSKSHEQGIT